MDAGIHSGADGGHRLRLGEDLGIGADADFQILAPRALLDQHFLQTRRFGRTRLQLRQIIADEPIDLGADLRRGAQVAARAFLDHPLDHGDREGDSRGLDRLEVDGCQQPGLAAIALSRAACSQARLDAADVFAVRRAQCGGRIGGLAQVAHGGEAAEMSNSSPSRTATTEGPPTSGRQTRPARAACTASSGSTGSNVHRPYSSPMRDATPYTTTNHNRGVRPMALFGSSHATEPNVPGQSHRRRVAAEAIAGGSIRCCASMARNAPAPAR